MDKESFLKKCKKVGVDSIVPIDNEFDEGFCVVLKDNSSVYVLFKEEYGDAWMEYETESHFNERWKNTHILTDEERDEFFKKSLETLKEKYSEPNFSLFMEHLFPDKKQNP